MRGLRKWMPLPISRTLANGSPAGMEMGKKMRMTTFLVGQNFDTFAELQGSRCSWEAERHDCDARPVSRRPEIDGGTARR